MLPRAFDRARRRAPRRRASTMPPEADADSLPPYPYSPRGAPRMGHPPTVDAGIRHWEAARARAVADGDRGLARTAAGLRLSYEAARLTLDGAGRGHRPPQPSALL